MNKITQGMFPLLLFALLSSTACKKDADSQDNPVDSAEIVFVNGQIYTVNEAQPWAEAILIKDGQISRLCWILP